MTHLDDLENDLVSAELEGTLIATVITCANRRELKTEDFGTKLSKLHNSGLISLTSESNRQAIHDLHHQDFWIAIHYLEEAIVGLAAAHNEMLAYVNTLVTRAGNDGFASQPNLAFATWCKKNPSEALKVIDFVRNCDPLALKHGVFAVTALENQKIPFELIASAEIEVRKVGIKSLGRMEKLNLHNIKSGIKEVTNALKNESDEEYRIAAIETAFRLWEKAPPSARLNKSNLINTIGGRGNPPELTTLAAMLFYYPKSLASSDIDLIFEWLSKRPSVTAATLRHLDMAISRNDERWKFNKIVQVLEFCLPMLDEPVKSDNFYGLKRWLWSEPKHASYLFSRWLQIGNRDLCNFIFLILGTRSTGREVNIHKRDLPPNTDDQIFLAKKCVGYFWSRELVVASILLSIVRNGTTQGRAYAEELLFHPMLLSYGGKLRDYLNEQRSNKSKRIAVCVERLLDKHDKHIAVTEEVRDAVVELRPTNEQRRAVAIKDRDRSRYIQKTANQESIFAGLFTHQTLLYGSKSLSIVHGMDGEEHSQITPMTEHAYSFELPRLSVIDPVGFKQILIEFQSEERDKS